MAKQTELTLEKKNGVAKIQPQELTTKPKETALGEIHFDVEEAKQREGLLKILATSPPPSWVKEHPMTKGKYLPINRVEDLLRRIFQRFRIEVKDSKVIANAVTVTVRIHYIDPVTGEWDYQDGVGAMAIQVDKGQPAMDFNFTKSDAIMKALPAAKSYAVKDAVEVLGKIFGGDLNRKDDITFTPAYDNRKPITEQEMTDAKRRASLGDTGVIDILHKYCLLTDAQIKEIETAYQQPE